MYERGRQGRFFARSAAILGGLFLALATTPLFAFMDSGGRISRDLAVGEVDGQETIYATWQGTGNKNEPLTLFALCADGSDCAQALEPDKCVIGGPTAAEVLAEDCGPLCRWKVELPDSRGTISYAPPTVSADGKRIVVATRDQSASSEQGRVYAFDHEGNCKWVYESGDEAKKGYYARPAIHQPEVDVEEYWVAAVNRNPASLHLIRDFDYGTNTSGQGPVITKATHPSVAYAAVIAAPGNNGGEAYFEPIFDPACGAHGVPRIYAALHGGSSKRGLYAYDTTAPASPVFANAWIFRDDDIPPSAQTIDDVLAFRLGGVIVTPTNAGGEPRYLVGNLRQGDGAVSIQLPPGCVSPAGYSGLKVAYAEGADGSQVKEAHRTRPTATWESHEDVTCDCPNADGALCPASCRAVVYVGQKQGYGGSSAALHHFEPTAGDALPEASWSWPSCATPSHTMKHTSWASPVVDEVSGNIFIGTNQDTGIHRVDTGTPGLADDCPAADSPEWYEPRANGGWRTTAAYSGDDPRLVHIGDSYGVLYSLETDAASTLEWCYDMVTETGYDCSSTNLACCGLQ